MTADSASHVEARHRRNIARCKVLGAVVAATLFIIPFKVAAADGHGAGAALGLLASVCIWFGAPAWIRVRRASPEVRRRSWQLGWRIAIAAALGNIAQGYAFSSLHPGVAAVFIQTNIVFVALLGALWLREPLLPKVAFGVLLTVLGVAASQADLLVEGLEPDPAVLWALGAALAFAGIDLLSRRGSPGSDSLVANVVRSALASVALAFVPGALTQLAAMGPERWTACALAALLGPGIARLLLISASRELPAVESGLLQQTRPLLALPAGSLFFGDWPTVGEWVGCAVIFAGLVVAMWPTSSHRLREAPPG